MKKTVSLREFIMLATLIVIIVYYFALYNPLKNEMSEIETMQADVLSEIDVNTAKLVTMKRMQNDLDEIFENADGDPAVLADYDNSYQVIMELNSILDNADNYSIAFKDDETSDYIVRRNIEINFSTSDYDAAIDILNSISDSQLYFLIQDLNLTDKSNSSNGGLFDVSVKITCFEYIAQ